MSLGAVGARPRASDGDVFDAVGVGAGPFNLSLAALLAPYPRVRARFFERSERFRWHPGLLLPGATIQVPFLKDLVTLADPTSRFSFLAFLHAVGRLYRFINLEQRKVSRREFQEYMAWVAERVPSVEFDAEVREIRLEAGRLRVALDGRSVTTSNVVLGTGLLPNIPSCARPHIGPNVLHSSEFLLRHPPTAGRSVAVVGGGQSGAEVVSHLLTQSDQLPARLLWISRRPNFLPLDESPFTNEQFSPAYSDYFYGLLSEQRRLLLAEQKLASDGVAEELLRAIHARLYELEFVERRGRIVQLLPRYELRDLRARGRWELELVDCWDRHTVLEADLVLLCTGARYSVPPALLPLLERIPRGSDGYEVRPDFSIVWDGPRELRIYVQNASRHARGVADPNLSLMAWRSAVIANSLLETQAYPVSGASSVFDFDLDVQPKEGLAWQLALADR